MAGTSFSGTLGVANFGWDLAAPFVGNGSLGVPFKQWSNGPSRGPDPRLTPPDFFTAGGTVTAAGGFVGTKPAPTARVGPTDETQLDKTAYDYWWEQVHILPRVKIEFGNIITLVERNYEVYSAFRRTTLTLAAIANNTLPGTNLPNVTPPITVPPQTSILDPSTTENSGGAGLGTIVRTKVQALQNGLPTFDSNILFDFGAPGNDVQLLLSGTRISLVALQYEAPVKETLAFLTDIIEALDGKEQRIALRKQPRQRFDVLYKLDGNDRQRLQALLFDWQDQIWGLPLWHEQIHLSAAVSAGATLYPVRGADVVDLRVGGLAAVITSAGVFDVINIAAVTATQVTASDASVNSYAAGTALVPVRPVMLTRSVAGARALNNLETFRLNFECIDNDTGAPTGSTTPGFWTTYNSRVLFDDANVVDGDEMPEEFIRRVYKIDNSTGKVTLSSNWDIGKRGSQKGFVLRNRADIYTFRRLLLALRGRQKAFYIPTFIEDLTVNANLSIGAALMDVDAHDYVRLVANRLPMKVFRITFTDGTSLIRSIQSSATVSGTVERLTLDTTWPANRNVSEISRVEFYELVRFDSDEITITYPRAGLAFCFVPLMRVFDDN